MEKWFENMQRDDVFISHQRKATAKENSWSAINKKYQIQPTPRGGLWKIGKIASVTFILAVSAFILYQYSQDALPDGLFTAESATDLISFINSEDTPVKISLNDGSSVLVHAGSEIRYPKKFSGTREVYLSGEGFFDIAKDPAHPFLVHANEITTRVLGTSFSVKAYWDQREIVVAVSTGRVSVSSKPNNPAHPVQEVILTPNQQVAYHRNENTVEKQLVEVPKVLVKKQSIKGYAFVLQNSS